MREQIRKAGEMYVAVDVQCRCKPESFVVFTEGDGTLAGDTICHGIFWHKEDAELFLNAKKNYSDLQKDSLKLSALEEMGVDNWSGYDDAMTYLESGELT